MKDETRSKLEAWLHYYEALGIRSFYGERAPGAAASSAAAPPAVPAKPDFTAEAQRPQSTAAVPPPAAPALPVLSAPSLFDAVERVEGDTLERIRADIGDCTRCRLHRQRTHIVYGVGNPKAEMVFVGEAPGRDEDVQGIPFVGRAGQLLTRILGAMGLRREDVYICNVIKCRPPENRSPERDEIATCAPFLLRQLGVIAPKAIVCLGNVAAQTLLGSSQSIAHFRGRWYDYHGSRLIVTYHPAYLLRNPGAKPEVWKDLQKVMAVLGLKAPPRRQAIL
jgi:DNA polymerase